MTQIDEAREREALAYATRLAQTLWQHFYRQDAPHWKPLPDLIGVLTQIDNMTCGLQRRAAAPAARQLSAAMVDRIIAALDPADGGAETIAASLRTVAAPAAEPAPIAEVRCKDMASGRVVYVTPLIPIADFPPEGTKLYAAAPVAPKP